MESFEDDYRVEFGILITPDGRITRYHYDYYRHGDVTRGTFTDWTDVAEGKLVELSQEELDFTRELDEL